MSVLPFVRSCSFRSPVFVSSSIVFIWRDRLLLESMVTFVLPVDFGFKAYVIRYKSLSCSSKWHVVLNFFRLFPSFNSLGIPTRFGCSVYVSFLKPFCQRNVSVQTIGSNIPSLQGNVNFGMMDEIFPTIVCTWQEKRTITSSKFSRVCHYFLNERKMVSFSNFNNNPC